MKTKKNVSFYILICCILSIIYIFAAVRKLSPEYQFIPEWKIDTTTAAAAPVPSGTHLNGFRMGQTLGYFTDNGKLSMLSAFPFKASISREFYTIYSADSTSVELFKPDGTSAGIINATGFPFVDEDRIFIFMPGGSSLMQCNTDGSRRWAYSGTVPITAFASSIGGCVAGFADGSVRAFSPAGDINQEFSPGGSDYSVILGAAISSSGKYLATLSGQNRQRFVLAEKDGIQTKIIFHEFLDSSDACQRLVKFSNDDKTVYYNYAGSLGIADVKTGRHKSIRILGQVLNLQEAGNLVVLLSKNNDAYTVSFIEKFGTPAGAFSFTASNAFIRTDGDKLYVGRDTTISCITINKK